MGNTIQNNGDNWSLLKNDQLACQPILKMYYIHKRLFGKPTNFYFVFLSVYRFPLHLHIFMHTISDSWKLLHKISHINPQILSLFLSIPQAQTPSFLQLHHASSTISSWRSPGQDVFHFALYDLPHSSAKIGQPHPFFMHFSPISCSWSAPCQLVLVSVSLLSLFLTVWNPNASTFFFVLPSL